MISNRLKSLVKYVNKNDSLIDIGCDHALLDIYLIKNNIIDKCIISDISNNALKQGIDNIKKYNLESKIETRCGDGLKILNNKDNINTIIISGMGANTILSVLNNPYIKNINKLIIQSNNDYYTLRKDIIKMGFIIKDVIIDHKKLYINIIFVRGEKLYTENELMYGTKNMINKETYYKYLLNKKEIILNKIKDENQKTILTNEINFLKNMM